MESEPLEYLVSRSAESISLRSPDVGYFMGAPATGAAIAGGQLAGSLEQLGRNRQLIVPRGVTGVVSARTGELTREPVGYGCLLLELVPLDNAEAETQSAESAETGLAILCPQAGRFYCRSGPDQAPFTAPGSDLQEGSPVGLIEVMKTFTRVTYSPSGGLPERCRVKAWLVEDGAEVTEGQPLIEIEPA